MSHSNTGMDADARPDQGCVATLALGSPGSLDTVELRVTDASFRSVASGFGSLTAELPPGIYEVEMRAGNNFRRSLVKLRTGERREIPDVEVETATIMPVTHTISSRETFRHALEQMSRIPYDARQTGLVMFLRQPNEDGAAPVDPAIFQKWTLRDANDMPIDFLSHLRADIGQGWAGFGMAVAPGGYTLEVAGSDRSPPVRQTLWLQQGWTTGVFLSSGHGLDALARSSLQMILFGMPWPFDDPEVHATNRASELAQTALSDNKTLLKGDTLRRFLSRKFQNPFLGIIALHGLLMQRTPDQSLIAEVIDNLQSLIPGHPDLEALKFGAILRCGMTFPQPPAPVEFPPILNNSYQLLMDADGHEMEGFVDGGLAECLAPLRLLSGLWLTWSSQPVVSTAVRRALKVRNIHLESPRFPTLPKNLASERLPPALAPVPLAIPTFRDATMADDTVSASRADAGIVLETTADEPEDLLVAKIREHLEAAQEALGPDFASNALTTPDPREISRQLSLPIRPVRRAMAKLDNLWSGMRFRQ